MDSVCSVSVPIVHFFFFFNDTATTEIYTLSLHDALPISPEAPSRERRVLGPAWAVAHARRRPQRSEEHTSELQSQSNLVCRLLLEKKKKNKETTTIDQRTQIISYGRSLVFSPVGASMPPG